ncbi:MAG: helix-turn-helix transcriptional regulator [Deltaproteobacteria bacterium]|nr:helix-turn-helix transcriptional regulator [Deltaproteobacteria bacterium]NND29046.1 helix-turn-helix transcriptional regulator [Myxococcales bacterium]MBT8464250.1 helix-turn-helix transcriptional regulator [Deltaproteobacteria bacterium]MBT8480061.1 helix-turn-helix transcriptional regulator [Deltaproteobacteria bacterium]NNK05990.1 helix-turn-helix transcriptional regulator [Myxococcales bacterium]
MDPVTSEAIDLIEVAYDLEGSDSDWLSQVMDAAAPMIDHGLGMFGFAFVRPEGGGGSDAVIGDMQLRALPPDFPARFAAATQVLSPEFVRSVTPPGYAGTWSEIARDHPEEFQALLENLGYVELFGMTAIDPDGVGVDISAPLRETMKLSAKSRERWQMLGAHIASAYRLRRALMGSEGDSSDDTESLPYGAEAVLDANHLQIVDAIGPAKDRSAAQVLRRAARKIDKARGQLRKDDPRKALETWKALVRGRWSVVDWFDSDGRRFVLARPNPPKVFDPRGLSAQECQVVTYVLFGDTNKLIAYRLGLSQGRVSVLLKSAMHKLGAKSKAQLVQKLGPLGVPTFSNGEWAA